MSYSPNFRGSEITNVTSSSSLSNTSTNSTGVTLNKLTPVKMNASGVISAIDVSNDESLSITGVVVDTMGNGVSGQVASGGTIKDIGDTFNLGDTIYVSKFGDLTNIKPDIGVNSFIEGDYIIRIGIVGKNEDNSSLKDLYLSIDIVGQL